MAELPSLENLKLESLKAEIAALRERVEELEQQIYEREASPYWRQQAVKVLCKQNCLRCNLAVCVLPQYKRAFYEVLYSPA